MAICQPVQAACKTKQVKQESVAKSACSIVHILFTPAAVAECGLLCQGYLLRRSAGNTQYNLYNTATHIPTLPHKTLAPNHPPFLHTFSCTV